MLTRSVAMIALAVTIGACRTPAPVERSTLAIGGSGSLAALAESLASAFAADRPALDIRVSGGNSAAALDALRQGSVDLVFVDSPVNDRALRIQPIGTEPVAIILHPSNIVASASADLLGQIFLGRIRDWADAGGQAGPILIVSREAGDGGRSVLETALMPGRSTSATAVLAPADDLMISRVATTPGAIGYVGLRALNPMVRVLKIEGDDPTAGRYPIVRPLAIVSRPDASVLVNTFIAFAQSDRGRQITGGTR